MKKRLLVIMILFSVPKIVHAEVHPGPQCSVASNSTYPFTITTAGPYVVTLHFSIHGKDSNISGGQIHTVIDDIGNIPILWAYAKPNVQATGSISYILHLDAKNYSIHAVILGALDAGSFWSYDISSAEEHDYQQALNDIENQLNILQININNQNTILDSTATLLANQSQQLSDINDAITNIKTAIITSSFDIKHSFSDQIATLQTQLIQTETDNLKILQAQLAALQNSIDAQGISTSASLTDQNNKLSDVINALTIIQSSLFIANESTKQSFLDQLHLLQSQATQIQKALTALATIDNDVTNGTGLILKAINGVSQQVNGVNNNVTTGNSQNQTLGIIGVSLGGVALGASIGIPLIMKTMSHTNEVEVNVVDSLETDRESLFYISPGQVP